MSELGHPVPSVDTTPPQPAPVADAAPAAEQPKAAAPATARAHPADDFIHATLARVPAEHHDEFRKLVMDGARLATLSLVGKAADPKAWIEAARTSPNVADLIGIVDAIVERQVRDRLKWLHDLK